MEWFVRGTLPCVRCGTAQVPSIFRRLSPDPAGAVRLFARLAAAGLGQDRLPLDIGLVVRVDGGVDVEGVLQVLAGAGVQHGPLCAGQ